MTACLFLFTQVTSTLRGSQVSVCSAWTQISLKTPFWSQATQQAAFRSGTFLPMRWRSKLRCAGCQTVTCTAPYLPIDSAYFLFMQAACERPHLLQSWKAHKRALICVDVLEVADRLLILTASADGSADLWTKDGDHVGLFGQEVMWNITDPGTYHR